MARLLKLLPFMVLALAYTSTVTAAEHASVTVENPGAHVASGDGSFPHVAHNQHRPAPHPIAMCATCSDEPGFDDGVWDPNACNCNRRCDTSNLCYLAPSTSGCKGGYGGCSDCSTSCTW